MDFFDHLVRFETDLWNAVERQLARSGQVGLGTLQALRILDRHDGAGRVHELSEELSITIGAASKVVDRLERDGLATRRPHPEDRRSSLVALTFVGQQARQDGEKVARAFIGRIIEEPADAALVVDALRRLQDRLTDTVAEVTA
ncbi:MarR family transcriptional regulator [Microbacterium sp. 2FI]|uniref:MarR family winged helix-turn-helix transcriptional regulator n=1 Tax=Microbacterium sp. 2FI TaxID=2502193 RepID=UPI001484E367|nr:MarR family transcriptional regulator [Microbacterium sp. 2FI]